MKALSVKQPWAELIASGAKPVEVRSWRTDYRGPLAIVASTAVATWAAQERPNVSCAVRGALVCVVELVEVRPLRRGDRFAAAGESPGRPRKGDDEEDEGAFAWVLRAPRRCLAAPVRGRLSLYTIDDAIVRYVPIELAQGA